jgi:hypothetical protein
MSPRGLIVVCGRSVCSCNDLGQLSKILQNKLFPLVQISILAQAHYELLD